MELVVPLLNNVFFLQFKGKGGCVSQIGVMLASLLADTSEIFPIDEIQTHLTM